MEEKLYLKFKISIGEFARILNVHPRTLRIWEKEKILIPKRSVKNRRCYTYEDLKRAKLIQVLTKNFTLNLIGVKLILTILKDIKCEDDIEYIERIAKLATITKEIQNKNIEKTSRKGRKKLCFKNNI